MFKISKLPVVLFSFISILHNLCHVTLLGFHEGGAEVKVALRWNVYKLCRKEVERSDELEPEAEADCLVARRA